MKMRALLLAVAMIGLGMPAAAQFTTTGEIFGWITGPQGEPLRDVKVTLTSDRNRSGVSEVTDADGHYRIPDVPPASYAVAIASEAHALASVRQVIVRAGSALRVDYRFPGVSAVREEITVEAEAPHVEATRSDAKKYISAEAIQNLPLQTRHFLDLLMIVPGIDRGVSHGTRNSFHVHGARSNQNQFFFDGVPNNDRSDLNSDSAPIFLAGPRAMSGAGPAGASFQVGATLQPFNIDAIEQVQLATSLFSAEYGYGSGGVINVVTRTGGDLQEASVTLQHQSDDYLKDAQQRSDRYQGSLTFGGPLIQGRTRLFASLERDEHSLGYDFGQPFNTVGAFLRDLDLTANKTERLRATAKISHEFSERHHSSATINYSNEAADVQHSWLRSSLEALVPERHLNRGITLIGRDVRSIRDDRLLESLASATLSTRRYGSLIDGPTHVRLKQLPDGAIQYDIQGPYGGDSDNWIRTYSISEKLSGHRGNGSWKAGVTSEYFRQETHQYEWFNIAYFFGPAPAYGGLIPDARLSPSVTESAAFVQYDWYKSDRMTWNLGLRGAHDDLVGEVTIEPRIGFAFDPSGIGRSVLRAGIGIYHDRSNLIGHTGADRPPVVEGPLNPVTLQLTPEALPTEIVVDPELHLPRTFKASVGYERQLPRTFVVGVHAHLSRNRDLFYSERLNRRSALLGGKRPDPARGEIEYYTNAGRSDVHEMELEVRRSFAKGAFVQGSYNRQRARGNSAFDFAPPTGPLNRITLLDEAPQRSTIDGPLDFEAKHSAKLAAVVPTVWGLTVSAIAHWRTGLPFTIYYSYNDPHPKAVFPEGYNSRRLENFYNVDARVAKSIAIRGQSVQLFVDVFNATDRRNILSRQGLAKFNNNGAIGAPGTVDNRNFLRVLSRSGPRTGQVGVRWLF